MNAFNPLELLTRDGWCHVISRVKIPEDILAVANTHPLFHSIIATEKEEVWMATLFYLTFPHFSDYLDKFDVLNLRLVKWIKPIIDKYLQQEKVLAFTEYPLEIELNYYLNRGNRKDLSMLLEEMRTLPIAKILRYYVNHTFFQETYLDCLTFFREFGSQVTYLTLDFSEYDNLHVEPIEALKFLKNILFCVPNITKLTLFLDCIRLNSGLPFDLWVTDVEQMWNHDQPPNLPKLKSFFTSEMSFCKHGQANPCFGTQVIRSILQTCSGQIEYLDVQRANLPVQLIPAVPTLKTLHVGLNTPEDVASLLDLQAPLTEININIAFEGSIQSTQVFLSLEHFSDTLLAVNIGTEDWNFGWMRELPVKVHLPQLRRLVLSGNFNGSIGPNFPFLENFPKLKTFELSFVEQRSWDGDSPDDDDDDKTGSAESCLYDLLTRDENNFYKSTIWEQLPDLKSVYLIIYPSPGDRSPFEAAFTRNPSSTNLLVGCCTSIGITVMASYRFGTFANTISVQCCIRLVGTNSMLACQYVGIMPAAPIHGQCLQ